MHQYAWCLCWNMTILQRNKWTTINLVMISGLIFMTWGTLVIEHSWNRVVAFICVLLQLLSLQEPSGWVDLFTPPLFSSDGTKMVLILPHDQGSRNGAFRHVSVVQKGRKVALTSGKFTVTEILSWDWARNLMWVHKYAFGTSNLNSFVLERRELCVEYIKWMHNGNVTSPVYVFELQTDLDVLGMIFTQNMITLHSV